MQTLVSCVMNIALFGLFGSGKSTLAAELAKKFNMQIVSSDLLKEYVADKQEGYRQIQAHKDSDKTKYLPESYFEKAFIYKYGNLKDGLIIDNIYTVQRLQTILKHLWIDKYILLDVALENAIQRAHKRGREDFNEIFLQNRLHAFNENIEEIKKLLGDKLDIYNANMPVKELHEQIFKNLY